MIESHNRITPPTWRPVENTHDRAAGKIGSVKRLRDEIEFAVVIPFIQVHLTTRQVALRPSIPTGV
jgi:hypothetical protein